MKMPREYDMTTRAAQAASSRLRILDATIELTGERPLSAVTLPIVAERAGVTVQTVLRKFGSREGLFEAAAVHGRTVVLAERAIHPEDVDASVDALLAHYERTSASTLVLLGQETWEPLIAEIVDAGKALHRTWVEEVFAQALAALPSSARAEAVDLLVVATDLYTYKLLRIDRGLSLDETRERMQRLIGAVRKVL
ncbi:helix-turn-helix domain-containing protein [Microbacterium panaciterrae]